MKRLIAYTCCICFCLGLQAQQQWSVTGYAGTKIIPLGTASKNKKGIVNIDLNNYQGVVTITPISDTYKSIEQHLEAIKKVNSYASADLAKAYVKDSLPFDVLYSSGLWKEYIQEWVGLYARKSPNADAFANDFVPEVKLVLNRIVGKYPDVTLALTKDLLEFFEQFGLDKAAQNIAAYSVGLDLKDNEHSEIASRLVTSMILIGRKAPEINGISDLSSTIILFYESGCHNCVVQIDALKAHYSKLQQKGLKVVAISADNDSTVFTYHSASFPWKTNICDLRGFEGSNFVNYGVASTPTIYLTDKKEIILGRYARLEDLESAILSTVE